MGDETDSFLNKLDDLHLNETSKSEFIDIHTDTDTLSQRTGNLSTPIEEIGDDSRDKFACSDNQSSNSEQGMYFRKENVNTSSLHTESSAPNIQSDSSETFPKMQYKKSTQCSEAAEKHSESSDEEYHSVDDGEDINSNKDDEGDDDDNDDKTKKKEIVDDEDYRKTVEERLSDDEKLERKDRAQILKNNGNQLFRDGSFNEAIDCYSQALDICPLSFPKERAIMFSNRAACKLRQEDYDGAISDCTKAIDLHPHYLKALLRRAELYDKKEKLDEALADFQKVVELDPSQYAARASCLKLAEQIKDRNEKMKAEMLGKLKDLGNMILRPFGISTENFQIQQDPNSGSYSVQYKPN